MFYRQSLVPFGFCFYVCVDKFDSLVYISSYSHYMWYLVKGLCEPHNDHTSLSVIAIQCTIPDCLPCNGRTEQLGFCRTSDFGNHADGQQECFQKHVHVYAAYNYKLQGFATDASERHWSIICYIILFSFLENRGNICLPQSSDTVP